MKSETLFLLIKIMKNNRSYVNAFIYICTYISLKTILCFSKLLEKKQIFLQFTSFIGMTYQLSPFLGQKLHLIHTFNNLKLVLYFNRTLFTSFCFDFINSKHNLTRFGTGQKEALLK